MLTSFANLKPEQKSTFFYLHEKRKSTANSTPIGHCLHGLSQLEWIQILLTLAIQFKGTFAENCCGNADSKERRQVMFRDKDGQV